MSTGKTYNWVDGSIGTRETYLSGVPLNRRFKTKVGRLFEPVSIKEGRMSIHLTKTFKSTEPVSMGSSVPVPF